METGNWKMETGSPKVENRKSERDQIAPGFDFTFSPFKFQISTFRFLVSSFQFPISSFQFPVSRFLRKAAGALLGVAAFAFPAAALAQGCPLCYNTAAAAKASGIQALRSGILILVIPPLLICAGILWRGIKARDLFNEPEPAAGEPEVERELAEMLAQTAPPAESWKIENRNSKLQKRSPESEIRVEDRL